MPTYGYRCIDCKHEFSVFQSMKDDPVNTCPECEGTVKRLLYPVGVVFKGSGWYITDSRKADVSEKTSGDAAGVEAVGSEANVKEDATTKTEANTTTVPMENSTTTKTE